jgi:hypothetical protein
LASAQQDKKTDDEKPADPDTGESTVEESTLGLSPNPLQKYGIKFAAAYIGEAAAAEFSVFGAFGLRCNQPTGPGTGNCLETPRYLGFDTC